MSPGSRGERLDHAPDLLLQRSRHRTTANATQCRVFMRVTDAHPKQRFGKLSAT